MEDFLEHLLGRNSDPRMGLFLSALLGSSLLPGTLSPLFVELDREPCCDAGSLILSSFLGGLLGKISTYLIGRSFPDSIVRRVGCMACLDKEILSASSFLAISWLPWCGDILLLYAGLKRNSFFFSIGFTACGWLLAILATECYRSLLRGCWYLFSCGGQCA